MENIHTPKLIMVLSGENRTERHRSKRTAELYFEYNEKTPILISGSHSGLLGREKPDGMIKECDEVLGSLMSLGVPKNAVRRESKSLCTLGNFFMSYPLISEEENDIDLVTDDFHVSRARWCSKVVFGNVAEGNKLFFPKTTTNFKNNLYTRLMEGVQTAILSEDLARFGVTPGDYGSLKRYMETTHPFYSTDPENQRSSLYGKFINIFKNKKISQTFLPTQKQAYKD